MTTQELISAPVLFGAFLLVWAFLARRSKFDAGLLALAGSICIFLMLRHHIGERLDNGVNVFPEMALAVLGLVMLVRVFMTPLGFLHRIGFLLAGLIILLPFVLLLGVILLFAGAFSGGGGG
jgi:hypothetical protein